MARAHPKRGKHASEIGAAIIGAWFKVLPDTPIAVEAIARNTTTKDVTVTISNHGLKKDDLISFMGISPTSTTTDTGLNGPTYRIVTIVDANKFQIVMPDGTTKISDGDYGSPTSGTGNLYTSRETVKAVLEAVINNILNSQCNVVIDDGRIKIPFAEPPVPDRKGLGEYLQKYHDDMNGQYQEDLGKAVLFGCGK